MSFTCVFLPFYIKVYYCEMFGFFLAFLEVCLAFLCFGNLATLALLFTELRLLQGTHI